MELHELLESGDRIMVGARWRSPNGSATEPAERFYQVLTIREGRIVHMRDCRSRREAVRRLQG